MRTSNVIKPNALRKGDTIGIVALSEPVARSQIEDGANWLRNEGFVVKYSPHLFERNGHLAGTDNERASDLMAFFADTSVNAIICGAGGTSGARILSLLDYGVIAKNPKIICGMSDPTSVLNAIHAKTGLVTFHGPVVQYNLASKMPHVTENSFRREIFADTGMNNYSFEGIARNHGIASGQLVGGNLSTLQQLLGTPYEPDWSGRILFWEDVCEQPHSLDARLVHFRNAGVFDKIAGMIIGVLESCSEEDYEDMRPIEEIALELTGCRFPVISGIPLGHTEEKLTLPIGVPVSINGDTGTITMGEKGIVE